MLKHARRNKLGYVSLKLVTSFRKVKHLEKDYQVVALCLRDSTKLQVNEEGMSILRSSNKYVYYYFYSYVKGESLFVFPGTSFFIDIIVYIAQKPIDSDVIERRH